MVEFYREVIHNEGCEVEFIFSNQAKDILKYTSNVLTCDIHNRVKTKENIISSGGTNVYGLYEIMTKPINGSGYNPKYGLLGSNKSTEEKLKLFPNKSDATKICEAVKNRRDESHLCGYIFFIVCAPCRGFSAYCVRIFRAEKINTGSSSRPRTPARWSSAARRGCAAAARSPRPSSDP